jgi:4'-phosphopantetheinyl transferase
VVLSPAPARWSTPPSQVALHDDDVHVWLADLDVDPYESEQVARYLTPDEHERAARIRLSRDRQRWTVARGTLRMLLGLYLDTSPRLVELTYAPQGKPALGYSVERDIRFNLSYSEDLAIYAFSVGRDIGVNMEYCRPDDDELPVAERLFPVDETAFIATHIGPDRQRAFLRCWTAKWSYLKARGLGLTTAARNHVRVLRPDEVIAPRDWVVVPIDPTSDAIAMLAVQGAIRSIEMWQWHSPFRAGSS